MCWQPISAIAVQIPVGIAVTSLRSLLFSSALARASAVVLESSRMESTGLTKEAAAFPIDCFTGQFRLFLVWKVNSCLNRSSTILAPPCVLATLPVLARALRSDRMVASVTANCLLISATEA